MNISKYSIAVTTVTFVALIAFCISFIRINEKLQKQIFEQNNTIEKLLEKQSTLYEYLGEQENDSTSYIVVWIKDGKPITYKQLCDSVDKLNEINRNLNDKINVKNHIISTSEQKFNFHVTEIENGFVLQYVKSGVNE